MKWIKVEDKLPELHERVLCLFNGKPIVFELDQVTHSNSKTFGPYMYWLDPYSDSLLHLTNAS